ncbi:MAG: hypothetical protein HY886_02495 [Deltaproteobacteria bacterium]|nr:hypothetical protein [Deltaproteobacteria bacterium]
MLNWYLLYTKPKHEDAVSILLAGAGFKVLNPKLRERRYVRRKLMDVVAPLFPCYLFVRFDDPLDNPSDYRLIRYTRGVKKVVGVEGIPTAAPDAMIREIEERMSGGLITISQHAFNEGDAVHIKGGHLEGLSAVFERPLKGTERVSILLKTLNARVVVDMALLEKD